MFAAEARKSLEDFLEAQSEKFRQPPTVWYVEHIETKSQTVQRYVRVLSVNVNGEIDCLDYWIRVAARKQLLTTAQRVGCYSHHRGWRIDARFHQVSESIRDLLNDALKKPDYVKTIQIRELR